MTNVLAIVPARGGSKGIPNKNLVMCAGKPLIEWTLDALQESSVQWMYVSTDSWQIAEAINGPWPPVWLHKDTITDEAQIEDRLDEIISGTPAGRECDIIVLLQPTSPVRTGRQIDEAIEQLQREGADSLVSVVESHAFLWRFPGMVTGHNYDLKHRPRRQDMSPQYEETGSIYVFTREHWERTHNRLGGKISLYCMAKETGYQIDDPFDLWLVGQILERELVRSDR